MIGIQSLSFFKYMHNLHSHRIITLFIFCCKRTLGRFLANVMLPRYNKRTVIFLISKLTKTVYQKAAKPLLFKRDPEVVHDTITKRSVLVGKIPPIRSVLRLSWAYQHPSLKQTIAGIDFKNPIGLGGGFDKNCELVNFMPNLGFGFMEVGSITQYPCEGNAGQRLWRMPKSKSILVYYGLKNEGVDTLAPRLAGYDAKIPIGANIAKTNNEKCADDAEAIADYVYSFKKLAKIGDYVTVNISCPNTYGGQPFHDKERLSALFTELDKIPTKKPVFVKISPDISTQERKDIAKLSFTHRIDGFICGNLTKDRNNPHIKEPVPADVGGMGGRPVFELSNQLIKDMYTFTKGKKIIIGLGGVFSAEDAYAKIKLGASLVQMVTGLIFEGPQVVGQINRGLVKLLHADGYTHISQAIGSDASYRKS